MFTFANLQHFKLEFKWFACRAREMHCMADICEWNMEVWGALEYIFMNAASLLLRSINRICLHSNELLPLVLVLPVNVLTFRANIKIICCRNLEIYIKNCVVVHCIWNGMDVSVSVHGVMCVIISNTNV